MDNTKNQTLGIIREEKNPPDKRVPLTPSQCAELKNQGWKVIVQSSNIRAYSDEEYRMMGIEVMEDISGADILLGVKEVPIEHLIQNKTYLFFSHTIKMQPYNRDLLRAVLAKNIRLVDYECLTNQQGKRVIGFGKYAGIVGAYNGLLCYGEISNKFNLKPAHECKDRIELEEQYPLIDLPSNYKIAITGSGRVTSGIIEVLEAVGIRKIQPADFLLETFDFPVFTQLTPMDYVKRKDDRSASEEDFYASPEKYISKFTPFTQVADMLITGHYWDSSSPFFFQKDDVESNQWKIRIIADISCDIDGPIPSTIRPSTIADPIYGYHRFKHEECNPTLEESIAVMAVDNLPCELPRDASREFGEVLSKIVLPSIKTNDQIIQSATIARDGNLTEKYRYLGEYVGLT